MFLLLAGSILLSACTYLFDFGSNLAVLYAYSRQYSGQYSRLCYDDQDYCPHVVKEAAIGFWVFFSFFLAAHILNAIMFRFRFKNENPYMSAYFLPLIHLWRLYVLLRTTFGFEGVQYLRSTQMNALFCILGTSLEGVPLLLVQFLAYLYLDEYQAGKGHVVLLGYRLPALFTVSVVASLLSVAYNGGAAVVAEASADRTTELWSDSQLAICSGMFTVAFTVTRGLTYMDLVLNYAAAPGSSVYALQLGFFPVFFCAHGAYYWKPWQKQHSKMLRKCLTGFVFAYMSMSVGHLYPLVSEARSTGQLGTLTFELELLIITLFSLSMDMTVMLLGKLSLGRLLLSVFSAFCCLSCTIWYMHIDRLVWKSVHAKEQLTDTADDSDGFCLEILFAEA